MDVRRQACTVDVQFGRVRGRSSGVRSNAGVLPGVSRSYGLNGQLLDAFPGARHDHVHSIGSDRLAFEGPSDLQRRVAFGHHALYRDQITGVHRFLAKGDRRDLRRDYQTSKLQIETVRWNGSRTIDELSVG